MTELDDLQQIWKGQSSHMDLPGPEQVLNGIQDLHKKVQKERKGMTLSFILTFLILGATTFMYSKPFYIIGLLLIFLAMSFMLFLIWKNKEADTGNHFDLTNQNFLQKNIRFIQHRRKITTKYMPIYASLLILGLNTGYINILEEFGMDGMMRLGIHIGFTLLMVLAFYFGIKNHLKKFDEKIIPLLDSLRSMEAKK